MIASMVKNIHVGSVMGTEWSFYNKEWIWRQKCKKNCIHMACGRTFRMVADVLKELVVLLRAN